MRPLLLTCLAFTAFVLFVPVTVCLAADPVETVNAYHEALTSGNTEAALSMLAPELILFEDGRPELSRDEYAGSHLKADIKFSRRAERELLRRDSWTAGDTATVSSTYKVKGKSRGRTIRLESAETMVLKMTGDEWRIVHIHWSNHVRD